MVDAVDTIKILGSLLGNGALSKGSGGSVLTNVLGAALGGGQKTQGGGNIADVLGGLLGGQQQGGGGMADVLGSVLGGQSQQQQQGGGGLGGLLGGLMKGGQQQQQGGGGLGGLLGGLMKGGQQQSQAANNPMGDILGGLLGGGGQQAGSSGGGLGGLLGAAVTQYAQSQNKEAPNTSSHSCEFLPEGADQSQALDQASLMIRAMINAAKSDGSIDQAEQDNIVGKLGDISPEEAAFVKAEFNAPLDVAEFAQSIPDGMQQQVYAVSLMAIDLDTNKEAQYLHQLGEGLGISHEMSNQIHQQLGAPSLYA